MMQEQFNCIKQEIEKVALNAGRLAEEITLVAVSKTYPVEAIESAYELGCRDFGENKVQELLYKMEQVKYPVRWHFIGHLQTNKVKYIVGKVALIHSVDSVKLLEEIEKQSAKQDIISNVLLEVNISQEESKFGFNKSELKDVYDKVKTLKHICVKGLMTVAPYVEKEALNRPIFREIFQIAVDMQKQKNDNIRNEILSMGMSNDYKVAIQEGSTMIRIGTALFGERDYL